MIPTQQRRCGLIHRGRLALFTILLLALGTSALILAQPASATLAGAATQLLRAPYLTDLTATSVTVNWATTTQTKGIVKYGPAGSCAASSVQSTTSGTSFTVTVNPSNFTGYQTSVKLTGLSTGSAYCYRIFTGDSTPIDLLGTAASPSFTTLDAADATTPVTFDVFGDWGDTTNSGVNDGTLNANQAALDAQIAASGARFAITTGDIAYPGGTQSNYGDVVHTAPDVSGVFGPSYWALPGQSTPMFAASGNHGRNSNYLTNWPESSTVGSGIYRTLPYPSIDGTTANSYPTSYYAFSANGARFYVLDAAWSDANVGTATGGACGSHCKAYQVDHDAHWSTSSAEYDWLQTDLAAHPGGVKMAFFHYPLRSDDQTEPGDAYLQNLPGSSGSLEELLHQGGVKLVFNGHAHIYQRNVAPPGGVISYVTGGGGAKLTTVSKCAPTDAYAVGWSYSKPAGSACGAATATATDGGVFHFLKISVSGSTVSVSPVDSAGRTFDPMTYDLSADSTAPSPPTSAHVTPSGTTKAVLSWGAATDNVGVSAYDVYRNGTYLATVPGTARTYTDATVIAGSSYTYRIESRDLADNTASASVTLGGTGTTDTTPPSIPSGPAATGSTPTSIGLSWSASIDNVGVTSYSVLRGGVSISSVSAPATTFTDTGLVPATAYSYQVVAKDAAGNSSAASTMLTTSTQADVTAPSTPGTPTASSVSSSSVSLNWAPSSDDVGVVRYDVLRNSVVIGPAAGGTFTDTTVTPGTTYSYAVRAYDAASNASTSAPLSVTTPIAGAVFSDGFESGDLSSWTTVSGLSVQNAVAHTGTHAARETSTGTATYAYKVLPTSAGELWAQGWVNVASRSTSANLFGFRTSSGASIINLYVDTNGRISLRNNIGSVTTNSTTVMPLGSWHRLVLHAVVNGTASSVDVTLDGAPVPGLTLTGQDFGTSLISKLQLGETATGRTYDIVLDDVAVSTNPLS
jgi:chitodextrinase